jgi:multidrug efflux pump subunit AcrB
MTDEIRKWLEAGKERVAAVGEAVRRLAVPLFSSTVTTALAFLPMAQLPGPPGDFVGAIAVAVIIMVFSSFVLALTITPALAGWYLQSPNPDKRRLFLVGGIQAPAVAGAFARSLDLALRFPKLAILGAIILPVIGFGAMPTLKAQFFPGVDRDQFYVQIKMPDGTALEGTDNVARQAEHVIRGHGDVKNVHWVIGESAPAFYYNMLADQDRESGFAEALITTASAEATETILPVLQQELDAALPQARVIVRGLVQGPPVRAPIEIRIVGPELKVLREIGDEVRALMSQVPEIVQARTQLTGGAPKAVIKINEEKVRLAGLEPGTIARQLESKLEGAVGGSLVEGSEELPVRLRLGTEERGSVNALRGIDFLAPASENSILANRYPGIPLAALGSIRIEPAKSPIFRRDGERVNTVQGYVQRKVLPEEALKTIQLRIAESGIALPLGYRIEVGGDADAREEVLSGLLSVAGIVSALTVATIVLTFNSFGLAAIGGVVIILSVGLSALALAVFGYPFGIMAVIGLIGSIGVSINAAIIIITALQKNVEAMRGDREAIRQVVIAQSRHIVSTTVTTFGGFLPLILAGGGFWPPFAMAIAGGVLLSTIVSFFFVPPAFAIVVGFSREKYTARTGVAAIKPLYPRAIESPGQGEDSIPVAA